jgi:hypothetical protein
MLLKNIESYIEEDKDKNPSEKDLMSDIRYVCKSCSLITESLQKGCDVMQLANGDIIVTEMKPVTFQYSWDEKRGKLVRSQFGNKPKQTRPRKNKKPVEAVAEETLEVLA